MSAFVSPDACVEAQKTFPRRSISEISGRIWSRTILHRTSSNRQAYDSGNFCWNFPADLSSTVCNLCYDRSCGRNHGEKRAARRRRRREQDYEAQERAAREAEAEEYRDRLRLERTFADGDAAGVPEVYNGTASAYEHDSEESEETSSVEEEHPEEDPQDEKNTEKIVEEENSVAEDFYEKDSEKDTEEISEEEALPEASGTENYVEENAGISEEETVAAKGPTASERR